LFSNMHLRSFRFFIKYADTNCEIISIGSRILQILEMLDQLTEVDRDVVLEIRAIYRLLRVKDGVKRMLACRTRYGLFEPSVVYYQRTNAFTDVQGYIFNTLHSALEVATLP